jgi:wyosine [tRNA(Phe)-imidazoG37] synthetase (radical SAM superfamily)
LALTRSRSCLSASVNAGLASDYSGKKFGSSDCCNPKDCILKPVLEVKLSGKLSDMATTSHSFCSVYGPVDSWRYGRSLGIDPIGPISTCSFDCVYCQLGNIEHKTRDRLVFIPTAQILYDLQPYRPWDVDVITLSGSGEPTLALNLAEILKDVKQLTGRPVGVLTNASLLTDSTVREDLTLADFVAAKLDGVTPDQLRRVDRPVPGIDLEQIWAGLRQLRQQYEGNLAIQSMLLTDWSEQEQAAYLALMQELIPDEIQLNTPTRPRPLVHQLDARGNHTGESQDYAVRHLKPVSHETLKAFGDRIQQTTGIAVRYPSH